MTAKKRKRLPPTDTAHWQAKANQIARGFAPEIRQCQKCGEPVASGYCCEWCGDYDPTRPPEGDE